MTDNMQRRALKIEYDGTDFCGWQLQPGVRTVQGELERAIARASGSRERITLHGAGRTDSGVHARAQVAHFDSPSRHGADTYMRAINYWLPPDVSVTAVRNVSSDFHARFSSIRKVYIYSVIISAVKRPLSERYSVRYRIRPDIAAMDACARLIIGEHDFSAFTASGANCGSRVRYIFRSEWTENGENLHYLVEGNGFTYNMVRILTGSMLAAGWADMTTDRFRAAMESGDRDLAGPTAPAGGLMLHDIRYSENIDPFPDQ